MGHMPGWMVGAAGTTALVASFFAGGALKGGARTETQHGPDAVAPVSAADPAAAGMDVACEPGQRAVVRQAAPGGGTSVACTSLVASAAAPAVIPAGLYAGAPAPLAQPINTASPGYARPAVINEPVEVYRPRATPVRYQTREVARPTRSVKKSVAIIAGSTAAGATIGGLAKGKKGAVVGGLLGGGAAAVWDQVTRRSEGGR